MASVSVSWSHFCKFIGFSITESFGELGQEEEKVCFSFSSVCSSGCFVQTQSHWAHHHVTEVSGVFQTTPVSSEINQSPEGRSGAGKEDTNILLTY